MILMTNDAEVWCLTSQKHAPAHRVDKRVLVSSISEKKMILMCLGKMKSTFYDRNEKTGKKTQMLNWQKLSCLGKSAIT